MLPWIPDKQAVLQQQAQALEVKKKRVSRNKNPVSSHLNVASEAHEDLRYAQKVKPKYLIVHISTFAPTVLNSI